MRLPTFPSRHLANRAADSLSLSASTATSIAFLTVTQTFTSPTPTITVSLSGTAPEYSFSDEELSDWDSEDDEDLTWDDDIDGVTAEQLDCRKGGEDDSDDDSDDEGGEPKDVRPPPRGQPQLQPSGETPAGNGTITSTSLAPIAAPSATSTSLVLPSSAIPTTIVTSSVISTTTTSTSNSILSYTSSFSLPTSSLSSTPILISNSINTFVSPTPLSTLYTLTAGTGAIFGTPTTAIAVATSPAASGGNPGNNKTAAAGIAVGTTAGVVFVASAAFILARIRLKRNKASSPTSFTPSTPGTGDSPSPYMTRAVNLNVPPSPNPFTMSPTRRIMTNSELLDNVIAAAYAAEIVPNASRPVASTHASMMPPATVPGPAGAVYGYGYDDAESEVDDGMGPNRFSAALRVLVDPAVPVVIEQAAGDDTVMMWMDGMASPLPMALEAEETPVGFGGLGVGMPVENLDEPSFYDIDGVRIPSAYASERISGVTESERPDSPWDYEEYERTGLAPPGGYI